MEYLLNVPKHHDEEVWDPQELQHKDLAEYEISINYLLENGMFLLENEYLAWHCSSKGFFGSRFEAEYDIRLGDNTFKKGSIGWALRPEELLHLVCDAKVFKVVREGGVPYSVDELIDTVLKRSSCSNIWKCIVYRALRLNCFVVRPGDNYGGVYTIYRGNPEKWHSSAVVFHESSNLLDRIGAARIARHCGKSVIFPKLLVDPSQVPRTYSGICEAPIEFTLVNLSVPEGVSLHF